MSEDNDTFTNDAAALSFMAHVAMEMVDIGEMHSSLISNDDPEKREQDLILIKANSMMVYSSLLLMAIVTEKHAETAKAGSKLWVSPLMNELNQIAFAEEISNAKNYIEDSVDKIEDFANKENNEPPSESSNGSSDI